MAAWNPVVRNRLNKTVLMECPFCSETLDFTEEFCARAAPSRLGEKGTVLCPKCYQEPHIPYEWGATR